MSINIVTRSKAFWQGKIFSDVAKTQLERYFQVCFLRLCSVPLSPSQTNFFILISAMFLLSLKSGSLLFVGYIAGNGSVPLCNIDDGEDTDFVAVSGKSKINYWEEKGDLF